MVGTCKCNLCKLKKKFECLFLIVIHSGNKRKREIRDLSLRIYCQETRVRGIEELFEADQIAFGWHALDSTNENFMRDSLALARNTKRNYFTWDSICGNTRRPVIRRYPRFPWNQSGTLRTYGRTKSGFQIYSLCYLVSQLRGGRSLRDHYGQRVIATIG